MGTISPCRIDKDNFLSETRDDVWEHFHFLLEGGEGIRFRAWEFELKVICKMIVDGDHFVGFWRTLLTLMWIKILWSWHCSIAWLDFLNSKCISFICISSWINISWSMFIHFQSVVYSSNIRLLTMELTESLW